MTEPAHTNRLIHETSPYLRQHAHNPVDWYPWNEEALDKAHRENKPILLSIGYSACHWCHVMAHESFEDAATAQVMNELFVNIKVDREERPDLDKIYQTAFQMLHRRAGGWPLTMFLTHDDHVPFVGGTYFPNQPRYGMPAFVDILRRVSDHYRQRPADIRQQNQALLEILHGELAAPSAAGKIELTAAPLQAARDQAVSHFDPTHGGFGGDLFFLEHMAQKLDLSDDQRKQVEAIMNQQREQARPYVKTLVETRREMRHAMKGDDFDEAAIRAIAERQARAMTEMAVLRARGRHAMQQILTPEQRQRMRHQHRERRGDGADGGAPGFDGQED